MKVLKKFISVMLVGTIVFSVFSTVPFTTKATEISESIPAYVSYQAKRYSESFQQIFGTGTQSYANTYYNSMKNSESVISGIAIWEAAHIATSPSYSLESGLITKKDMYKLAIFDMLDVTESNTFVSNLFDTIQDERASYIVTLTKEVCDSENIEPSELKNLEVTDEYLNLLKDSAKAAKALEVVEDIVDIVSVCENFYEAINTMASYQTISSMKDGVEEILTAIANDTTNPVELRQAASECAGSFSAGYEHILNSMIDGSNPYVNATFETIFSAAVDETWDEIVAAIPGGKVVMMSAKGTRILSNAVFKMDDTCRSYYQFEANVALENAVRNVMTNTQHDFLQEKNRNNAVAYMRAVGMYKRIVLQGYDYVIDMLEVKASAPATLWFDWLNHDYSECMELIDGAEKLKGDKKYLYEQYEELVHDGYISLYCQDYNETMDAFYDQHPIYAESVTLSQIKEINIGDTGYIYDYIQKSCYPENSIESNHSYFTADNKDVFTIDSFGAFIAESAGQVILTYDEGGDLESSITITVGDTPTITNPYDYYGDFEYDTYGNKVFIKGYTGSRSKVIIPNSIDGKPVTRIDYDAFKNCTILTNITIPDSVTSIGSSTFCGCSSLTNITIPDSVTSIGNFTFYGCSSLTNITIPDSVTSIDSGAFNRCSSLTNITIPDSVTSIGNFAFYGCSNLKSISIPKGVTNIENRMFNSCSSLTSITIPDSVTSIDYEAFYGCSSLKSITIPNSVTSIGIHAFYGCSSLTSITIPHSVTSISGGMFAGCSSLTSVTIPDSVTSIDYEAFYGCSSLTSIKIPDSITSIGRCAFKDCSSLTSITIPNSVTSIGDYAFGGCYKLEKCNYTGTIDSWCTIDFGNSISNPIYYTSSLYINDILVTDIIIADEVGNISDNAFINCESLISITISKGVTSIGDYAFYGCYNLYHVFYTGSEEQWGLIDISDNGNSYLIEETRHYNAEGFIECIETVQPNCIKDGYNKYKCSVCNEEGAKRINALEHNYESDICTRCGKVSHYSIDVGNCAKAEIETEGDTIYFKFVPKETETYYFYSNADYDTYGYLYDDSKINLLKRDNNSGDNNNFKISYECVAGQIYYLAVEFYYSEKTGIIPVALESDQITVKHNHAVVETVLPTCTSSGYTVYECSICKDTYNNYIEPLGHDSVLLEIVVPTCTSYGYSIYKCSVCEKNYNSNYIDALGHNGKVKEVVASGCTSKGYTVYECETCKEVYNSGYLDPIGHQFENSFCLHCGMDKNDCIESSHPYENNCNNSWTINRPGASSISITFSDTTKTESNYDYVNIYDSENNLIGSYTGTELASQCITVYDDTIIINLTSDSSVSYYGFAIESIECTFLGDVNMDGEINIVDATSIQMHIAKLNSDDINLNNADVDQDGEVTIKDATTIQMFIAKLISDFNSISKRG